MSAPHKHAAVLRAYADGAQIQVKHGIGAWMDTPQPAFSAASEYRVKPAADPYAEIKAAAKAGKKIQFRRGDGVWEDARDSINGLGYRNGVENYRVKPEPELPPHFENGTRVWCFPKTEIGFEAVTLGFRANVFDSSRFGYDVKDSDGTKRFIPTRHVVEFDENHNQKRAFAQGKTIEFRAEAPEDRCAVTAHNPGGWITATDPSWVGTLEYRVKPDPVVLKARCKCSPITMDGSTQKIYVELDGTQVDGVVTNVTLAKWSVA